MDIHEVWAKALKGTEIIRARVKDLHTFDDTNVPYVFLAESSVNMGDTVVRKGEVEVQKPSLILPPNIPQFEGFEFDRESNIDENAFMSFLMVRGVGMPSLKYNNRTHSLDLYEDKLKNAIRHYKNALNEKEDVHTGLIIGPEDCWQFSVLIFVCSQIARNADGDIKKLMDEYRKRAKDGEK